MAELVICYECAESQLKDCCCGTREKLTKSCSHHPSGFLQARPPCPCSDVIAVMLHWECDNELLTPDFVDMIVDQNEAIRCNPGMIPCLNAQIDVIMHLIACYAWQVSTSNSQSQSSSYSSSQGAGWSWADSQGSAADTAVGASADRSDGSNVGASFDFGTSTSYSFGFAYDRAQTEIDSSAQSHDDAEDQSSTSSTTGSTDDSRDFAASWQEDPEIYGTSVDYSHQEQGTTDIGFTFGLGDGSIVVQPFGIGIDLSPDVGANRDNDSVNEVDYSRAHDVTRTTAYDFSQGGSTSRSNSEAGDEADGNTFSYSFSNSDEFGFTDAHGETESHSEAFTEGESEATSQSQSVSLANTKSQGYAQNTSEGESRNVSRSTSSGGSASSSASVAAGQRSRNWQMILDLVIGQRDRQQALQKRKRGFTICSGPILGDDNGKICIPESGGLECCEDIRPYGYARPAADAPICS